MARLNEAAPPPVESVDALKRRFVRQNRELTKANTTQSLRIRTLELETSRLLSENLALRSQIIALQHQSHQNQNRTHAVLTVKSQLEAKLEELGRLVCELGGTSATDEGLAGESIAVNRGPARSPDPKNWKNALALSDVAGGAQAQADGRLPVIMEDKYYPRRTMNPEELINLLSGPGAVNGTAAADSPDLGPPPIAHFETEEFPIRFDPNSTSISNDQLAEQEDGNPVLSANLETRKRRKDGGSNASDLGAKSDGSAYGVEKSRLSTSSAGKEEVASCQHQNLNLNPSAKRKLSAREAEEVVEEVVTITGKDEFVYNRSSEAKVVDDCSRDRENKQGENISNAKNTGDLPPPRGTSRSSKGRDGTAATTGASVRKALEPKSANMDPLSSPTKNGKQTAVNIEKIPDSRKDTGRKGRERERHRDRDRKPAPTTDVSKPAAPKLKQEPTPQPPSIPSPSTSPEVATDLPPETPASIDLFSPQCSTEPSAARPESRDTPPPPDLNLSTVDAFNTAGRASRRPRAGVSYAEPNLRDKMRRPTKALADAVGAEERVQRAINSARAGSESASLENDAGLNDSARLRTVIIKKENSSEPAWKHLPSESSQQQKYRAGATSPLHDRPRTAINGTGDLPASVVTERRHRGSSVHRADADEPHDPSERYPSVSASAAGTTIAALVAGTARKREKMLLQREDGGTDKDRDRGKDKVLDEPTDRLDIYAFHDSSPADLDRGPKLANGSNGAGMGALRASRRHSAMPSSSSSARYTGVASSSQSFVDPSKEDVGAVALSRPRPSSRSSGRRRGTLGLDGAADGPVEGEVSREGRDGGMIAQAKSVVDLKNVDVVDRAERVAARRRSMML